MKLLRLWLFFLCATSALSVLPMQKLEVALLEKKKEYLKGLWKLSNYTFKTIQLPLCLNKFNDNFQLKFDETGKFLTCFKNDQPLYVIDVATFFVTALASEKKLKYAHMTQAMVNDIEKLSNFDDASHRKYSKSFFSDGINGVYDFVNGGNALGMGRVEYVENKRDTYQQHDGIGLYDMQTHRPFFYIPVSMPLLGNGKSFVFNKESTAIAAFSIKGIIVLIKPHDTFVLGKQFSDALIYC